MPNTEFNFSFVIIYVGQRVFGGKFDDENCILHEAVEYYNILSPQGLTVMPIKMGTIKLQEDAEFIIVKDVYADNIHRDSYMKTVENVNIVKPSSIIKGRA